MARKIPPFRFRKASFAKAHPGRCRVVHTPSGNRYLCATGGGKSKKGRRR